MISLIFALTAVSFGMKLLSVLKIKTVSTFESAIFGLGIGFGVLAYLVLLAGLLKVLYWQAILAMIGVMALLSIKEVWRLVKSVYTAVRTKGASKLSAVDSLVIIAAVSLGSMALIGALSPPTRLDWDGLAYHLAIPKIYLSRHAIFYVPYISHSNFPFLTEMLYTVGLSLGSVSIAKLFHYWMYIGTAAAIFGLCRRHINSMTGKIAAVLFLSVPVVWWEAGSAYADISTALYITLAAYAFFNWEETRSSIWLIVCGVVSGFALGTKVLAVVPLAGLCMLVLFSTGRSHGWGRGFKLASMLALTAILVGSPWYIKSYIYTGNPVYPFMYNIFGGKYWSDATAAAYTSAQTRFGMGGGLLKLILIPWNLLVNGYKFYDTATPSGLIGMAFLGLIPIQILVNKTNKTIPRIGFIAALFILAWFFLMQYSRYLLTVMPLLAIIAAAGVDEANRRWTVGKHIVDGFVIICVLTSLIVAWPLTSIYAQPVFGIVSRETYIKTFLDVYAAESYINETTPDDTKVVLFDEVLGFYLNREYMWGNPNHHEIIPWRQFRVGKDMVKWFTDRGYTYAMINWKQANPDEIHQKIITDAIGHGLMPELFSKNGVSVYMFTEQ